MVSAVTDSGVEQHLDALRRSNPDHHELVQRIRQTVLDVVPDVSERVMYGGIMFSAPVDFCGVFSSSKHVSIEFSRGSSLSDDCDVLEGTGKLRRHIKVRVLDDLETKHVRDYVAQARDSILL